MRTLTFSVILGFSLVLSGVSRAGSTDGRVPNAGLFAFTGAPSIADAPQPMILASR
jgi:hypothetical protein